MDLSCFLRVSAQTRQRRHKFKSRPPACACFLLDHSHSYNYRGEGPFTDTHMFTDYGHKSYPCKWIKWYALNYKQDQLLVASFYCSWCRALFTIQVLTDCLMKFSSSRDEQKQILNQKKRNCFHAVLSCFKKCCFCFLLPTFCITINMP